MVTEPDAFGKPLLPVGVNTYVAVSLLPASAVPVAQRIIAATTMAAKVNRFIKPLLREKGRDSTNRSRRSAATG
jgi:hypothetical protein